jgi:hypothetical protein
MSCVAPVRTVGWKNVPPSWWRDPPSATVAPLALASSSSSSTLATASLSISGPLRHALLAPVADLQLPCFGDELLDEGVIDPGLHVDAVGADAGLARVAVFRDDGPLGGGIQIGVVEHDEGRVATKFHRNLLHRVGGLADQLLSDLGGAGEGDLAHLLAGHHRARNGPRRAR